MFGLDSQHDGGGSGQTHAVGASLLAKNSQTPRFFRQPALSLTFFASKLAPTGGLRWGHLRSGSCPPIASSARPVVPGPSRRAGSIAGFPPLPG
ncbi:hypothetical protein FJ692_09555 [Pseudomonas fluorescens]|nr:hypothetical protein C1751_11220 [Pseudomonas fluorescens]TPV58049.1 hypothetical protein FJ692_09555 [Pseudomonas fluorescens]